MKKDKSIREIIKSNGYTHAGGTCIDNEQLDQAEKEIIETILARFPEKKEEISVADPRYSRKWEGNEVYNEAVDQCRKAVKGGE